jgi:hypothetical protein
METALFNLMLKDFWQYRNPLRVWTAVIAKLIKMRTAVLPTASALALSLMMLIAPWGSSSSLSQEDAASRIQAKIAQVGAGATKLRESGGDVRPILQEMRQVDTLLRSGEVEDAEKILDSLLTKLGVPATPPARAAAAPVYSRNCDPSQPMTVESGMTLDADCTVGGDLTVRGNAVLRFDYTGHGGQLVVRGNVIVQDKATLWIQGRPGERAIFVIDNEFGRQRSISSRDDAAIKLEYVEFRTHASGGRSKGSISMSYNARNRSSFEVTGSMLVAEESWLLANLYDSAKLTVANTQHVPTEIYVRGSSSAKLSGTGTRGGIWLDMAGAKGSFKVPDVNGPFSWRIGAGAGLNVGWSFQVDDARPVLGIEVRPTSAIAITGNGARAPIPGELRISYFVKDARETLDGLKAGMQNRTIGNRLTLKDVQLGPIAWQIYAEDNADLTISNSTINEIGIFGRNAKVRVEHSLLQLALLAAVAPGSSLDIRGCEIWNQNIEAENGSRVSIADSEIHGTLFDARDSNSAISIQGGAFHENPALCPRATMLDLATGQPTCNPFRPPGMPRRTGTGKVECTGTEGCTWDR